MFEKAKADHARMDPVLPFFDQPVSPMLKPVSAPYAKGSKTSQSGAEAVKASWSWRQKVVIDALQGGPLSRQELEAVTKLKINAVCSVVGALLRMRRIEVGGEPETVTWSDGMITTRERLRLKK